MGLFHIIAGREPLVTTSAELAVMSGGDKSFIGEYDMWAGFS